MAANAEDRLRHLIAAWRVKPAVALADAIVALGAELDRARPKLPGKDKGARLSNWLKLQKNHDDVLTGWLLVHSFLDDLYRFQEPCTRTLPKWAPDPRLTNAMLAQLEPGHYVSVGTWAPLLSTLRKSADARAVEALERWAAKPDVPRKKRIEDVILVLKTAHPNGAPTLTAEELELLGNPARRGHVEEKDLLAAVWGTPADDAPRLVYADHLQERGDPRGEFIALQCRRKLDSAQRKRMRELQREHAAKWLGPLEPAVLENKTVQFERGFLSLCTICTSWGIGIDDLDDPRERAIRALGDHPAWATLREVRMAKLGKRTRAPLIAHLARLGVSVKLG